MCVVIEISHSCAVVVVFLRLLQGPPRITGFCLQTVFCVVDTYDLLDGLAPRVSRRHCSVCVIIAWPLDENTNTCAALPWLLTMTHQPSEHSSSES